MLPNAASPLDVLVGTGAVDSLDLKGQYKNTPVDVVTDPELYRMVIGAFPHAWLEDPDVTDQTRPILDPVAERVTWDAPIHSVADVLDRPWKPRMVNIKLSRFGPLSNLFEFISSMEGATPGQDSDLPPGVEDLGNPPEILFGRQASCVPKH